VSLCYERCPYRCRLWLCFPPMQRSVVAIMVERREIWNVGCAIVFLGHTASGHSRTASCPPDPSHALCVQPRWTGAPSSRWWWSQHFIGTKELPWDPRLAVLAVRITGYETRTRDQLAASVEAPLRLAGRTTTGSSITGGILNNIMGKAPIPRLALQTFSKYGTLHLVKAWLP